MSERLKPGGRVDGILMTVQLWECWCCGRTIYHPPPCDKFASKRSEKKRLSLWWALPLGVMWCGLALLAGVLFLENCR